jgi:protein-ribulosamine 3-kinase
VTDIWQFIGERIAHTLDIPFSIDGKLSVGGGSISRAYVVEGDGRRYFVKINHADLAAMFEAEAEALREITATATVKVPLPLCWGTVEETAYLVMEYLDLSGDGTIAAVELGRRLAALHRTSAAEFGWRMDNTIGATRQINTPGRDWVDFWRQHRLGYQLDLARANGHNGRLQDSGARLMEALPILLNGHAPEPVVFDPAVYYGDRETDIAMTELFGGFPAAFYQSYQAEYPLDPGYEVRKTLYNLYHILNHLNLFGAGYLSQAQRMIDALLREIR